MTIDVAPGRPKQGTAPISNDRGSATPKAHEVTSVGASMRRAGPPQASTAPSGGSAVHEVTSVGAMLKPGRGTMSISMEDMPPSTDSSAPLT